MDDMAAERKAYEEEASQKLNDLRKELESKEKQALENCEKMSKDYDIKLRLVPFVSRGKSAKKSLYLCLIFSCVFVSLLVCNSGLFACVIKSITHIF